MADKPKQKNKRIRGQNEGSIRQRKDDTWEARYTIGVDADGKQLRKSIYGKTRAEVAKKLTKVLNDINSGVYLEPSKLTVASWLDTWLEEYKKPSIKRKTYESYKKLIELYIKPAIGHIPLKDLRTDHAQVMLNEIKNRIPYRIQIEIKKLEDKLLTEKSKKNQEKINQQIKVLKGKKISSRTVEYVNAVLHGALEQALKNDLVIRNITKSVSLPLKEEVHRRVLTIEEQNRFMETLKGERLSAAFILNLSTGLRVGELLGLTWNNVDFKKGTLKVVQTLSRIKDYDSPVPKSKLTFGTPKTDKGKRQIPLLDSMIKLLKSHKAEQAKEKLKAGKAYEDNNLVFCSELGKPLDPRNISRSFYRLLDKANIEHANLHSLRHTFATRGLENGIELKVMQELLGHSTITVTADIYSHVLPEKKKESINKLKHIFEPVSK